MVGVDEPIINGPQGARNRVREHGDTQEPPGPGLRSARTSKPDARIDDYRQLRPGQCCAKPVRVRTNPGGMEHGHDELIGNEPAHHQEGDPQDPIAPEELTQTGRRRACYPTGRRWPRDDGGNAPRPYRTSLEGKHLFAADSTSPDANNRAPETQGEQPVSSPSLEDVDAPSILLMACRIWTTAQPRGFVLSNAPALGARGISPLHLGCLPLHELSTSCCAPCG